MDDADFVGESDGDTEEEALEPLLPPLPPPEPPQRHPSALHAPAHQLELDDDVMQAILSPVVLSEAQPSSSLADDGGMSERLEQDTALDTSTDGMREELAEPVVKERHTVSQNVVQDVEMAAQDGQEKPVTISATDDDQVDQSPAVFSEGDLVEVQSRTWPGINKPGGSGRIVRVHQETDENGQPVAVYDVRYVLGGLERRIEREYVELSWILQEQANARKPVGRIFYHDEYAPDKQRRTREARAATAGVPHASRGLKRKRPKQPNGRPPRASNNMPNEDDAQLSDSSANIPAGDGDSSEYEDDPESEPEAPNRPRLDARAFILQTSSNDRSRTVNSPATTTGDGHHVERTSAAQTTQRRVRPIIESDDEDDDDNNANHGDEIRPSDHVNASNEAQASVDRSPADSSNPRKKQRRSRNKKHYVGGYEHDGDDPDANFIQPEDNANSLPDDVAREVRFNIKGKTANELLALLHHNLSLFKQNIAMFESEKAQMKRKLKKLVGLNDTEMREVYEEMTRLDKFLVDKLIHEGEDVMNIIIQRLTKKRVSLADAIELEFDGLKVTLNAMGGWSKNAKNLVSEEWFRRGKQHFTSVTNDFVSDESVSEVPVTSREYYPENTAAMNDNLNYMLENESRKPSRQAKSSASRQPSNVYQRDGSYSRKTAKRNFAPSTMLDDYGFVQSTNSRQSSSREKTFGMLTNLRFPRRNALKAMSDPRWNWLKMAKQKQRQAAQSGPTTRLIALPGSRAPPNKKKRFEDSVQEKRFQLRNQRYKTPSTGTHHQRGAQTVPNSFRFPEETNIYEDEATTTYDHDPRLKFATSASVSRNNGSLRQVPSMEVNTKPRSTNQLDWPSIFEFVSREFEDIVMFPLSSHHKLKCSRFGHQMSPQVPDILLQALDVDDRHGIEVNMSFAASRLRQKLSEIRFSEQEFIHLLMDRQSSGEDIEGKFKSFPEWISLVALEDAFHDSIAIWAARALELSRQLPIAQLTIHLRTCVFEISQILRSLPDCNSLFSTPKAEYVFFFELVDREAKTTPVLSAIMHTFWYCVQTITALKSSCDTRESFSASDKEAIDSVFSELLPMRVILATARFLVDLYLYMPASHRWNDVFPSQGADESPSVSSIPAISLWILMFDCFDSGRWSLQQAKSITNEQDFWALLQTMYRHHFLEQLAVSFVRGESCGGYLHEVGSGNRTNTEPNQEELTWTSQLLASESAWDLFFILSNACTSMHMSDQRSIISGNEAKWSFVKDLLHPSKPHFLPFEYQADESSQTNDDFATYSQSFKELVFQRLLLLSKLWLARSDIVELLFNVVADTEQLLSLPNFVQSFLELCDQMNAPSWDRMAYIESIPMKSSDTTESVCKIILVMLMKLDKRIDQLRFRKAILAAVDSRHNKAIESSTSDTKPSTSANSNTKASTNWNWGGAQPVTTKSSPNKHNSTKQESTQQRGGKPQTRLLVSVLLVVAAADMSYDADNGKDKRSKSSKGNWGFYCKELTKLLAVKPELGSLCEVQALYVMGILALQKSTEYGIIFSSMNDHLRSAILTLREGNNLLSKHDRKLLNGAVSSSLQLFRDLTLQLSQLDQITASNSYDAPAIEASIGSVLNSGLELCFDAAIDVEGIISIKQLNVAIAILQLLHPQARDQPSQSLSLNVVTSQPVQEVSEFGEFDDLDDNVLASLDLDMPSTGSAPTPVLPKFTDTFAQVTEQVILSNLRGALQRLVFHYPSNGQSTSQELYVIDLLGAMISTCNIPFSWNARTFAAVKSRFLAPRLLSAVLKYHPEKDWFSTCFLSEPGAAQLLGSMWITGTLDIQSLLSNPCRIEEVEASYSLQKGIAEKFTEMNLQASEQIRYANYWLMLSDGIIFNVLRESSVVRYKTDPLILQLLQKTASTSKFVREVRMNSEPRELSSLLDVHLDLFRSFCDGCGDIWRFLAVNPSANRMHMNQFRSYMLDLQSGIFVSLTEAYEINLKMVSRFLDDSISEGWNALSAKFLEEFSAPSGTTSYHTIDESTEPLKERKRFRLLALLFKFMYANVDCFLFYCGEMATGQQNIFFTIIDMMFRQARCADFPQAQLRFRDASTDFKSDTKVSMWSKPPRKPLVRGAANPAGEISPACESFVENIRLFFARQKYPSLFHWFAQNLEHYQTLGMGWHNSKMRILLLNVLDPLGPLGIDSYYPIQVDLDLDVGGIKREAFYLACGLFICNHGAISYQHCRTVPTDDALSRMQKMRRFILNDFMWETFNYAQSVDKLCVLETLVPVCQFIRAVLSHCNLNSHDDAFASHGSRPFHFDIAEIYPCLESITLFFTKALQPDTVLDSVISCVLLIELSGIAIEALVWTEKSFNGQASQLLELIVMYFGSIYKILKRSSSNGLDPLFGSNTDQAYLGDLLKHFPPDSVFDGVVSIKAEKAKAAQRNTYGISEARVRSDLLSAIRRLVVQCKKSSNEFIRNMVA